MQCTRRVTRVDVDERNEPARLLRLRFIHFDLSPLRDRSVTESTPKITADMVMVESLPLHTLLFQHPFLRDVARGSQTGRQQGIAE